MKYASRVERRQAGRCWDCQNPALKGATMCRACLLRHREAMRARHGCEAWRPGGPGRPPKALV